VLLLGGAAVVAYETRGTLFWADEWQWILNRRGGGLGPWLDPHNEHPSLVPVALYKLLFATVGLRHYWPYRGVLILAELICTLLIFVYVRWRVGGYYALLAAALILFFGPGWQDILWPFQTAWILTALAGVGALLAIDRHDRAGDIGACVLLGAALASTGPGLAVAVGLVIEVLQQRRRRELWIVAVPIALYALWWLTYQHTIFSRHALLLLPRFVFDSAAGTLSSLTGLAKVDVNHDSAGDFLSWGAPLLVLALAGMVWRLRDLGRIPPRVVTLSAILLTFWLLTGLGRAYVSVGSLVLTATGDESRYLYIGAVFVVLLIAELARSRASRAPPLALGIGVLAAAAIISNLGPLRAGSRLLQMAAQGTQGTLAALDLSRRIVPPGFAATGLTIFIGVPPGTLYAAEHALGSPAPTATQLTGLPDFARQSADVQLIQVQGLTLRGTSPTRPSGARSPTIEAFQSGTASTANGCVRYRPDAYTPTGVVGSLQVTVPGAGLAVRAGGASATVSVRRFSLQFDQLGTLAPGASASLLIKPDLASEPWHLQISAASGFQACSLG